MKKFFVIIMVCTVLTACGAAPAAQTAPEETDAVRETVSEVPAAEERSETQTEQTKETRGNETTTENAEAHDTAADSKLSEDDEALELWINEMAAVDNAISELMESEDFGSLETSEKAEKMLALINGLAENGTEEYNYPLIKAETVYYDGGDMISFGYVGGGLGGVKLEPFDPMQN